MAVKTYEFGGSEYVGKSEYEEIEEMLIKALDDNCRIKFCIKNLIERIGSIGMDIKAVSTMLEKEL